MESEVLFVRVQKSDMVYENLKGRIYAGEFNIANRLPSEVELARYYGCSRPTLRKALDALESDHIIVRKQGSGSFLSSKGLDERNSHGIPERNKGLFGIIFPSLGRNYVFDIICSEVTRVLATYDCSLVWGGVVVPSSVNLMEDIKQICNKYVQLGVDGVFFAPIEYTPLRERANNYIEESFRNAGIPLVLIDSDLYEFPQRSRYDLVSLDHIEAGYLLTRHMVESHARNIHFLSPPMSAYTIKLRQIGYREALYDAGIPVREEKVHVGNPKDKRFVSTVLAFEPQAILCSNDGTAIVLQETLEAMGISVPKDVAVAGFDNLSYLAQIRVPLTSVSQPTERISREAVKMMMERCDHPEQPCRTIRLSGHLVMRKSTRFGDTTI